MEEALKCLQKLIEQEEKANIAETSAQIKQLPMLFQNQLTEMADLLLKRIEKLGSIQSESSFQSKLGILAAQWQFPSPSDSFTGQRKLLDSIKESLLIGGKIISLVGPGGAGKTQIVLQAVKELCISSSM
jgi:primosomal protein N'